MIPVSNEYLSTGPELTVFYDADCGFCSHSAAVLRALDRGGRLDVVPLTGAATRFPDAPPVEHLMDRMHVRARSGRWFIGGQAWIRIADGVPLMRPLGHVARLPLIRSLVEPVYTTVARNRHNLSRLLGDEACAIQPAPR